LDIRKTARSIDCPVFDVDGHDVGSLYTTLSSIAHSNDSPCVIVAKTIKGKGIPELENDPFHHYYRKKSCHLTLPDTISKLLEEVEGKWKKEA